MTFALTRIAAAARPATKTAAKMALKAAGMKQTLAEDLLAETARLTPIRARAQENRIMRRLGYCPINPVRPYAQRGMSRAYPWHEKPTGPASVRLPAGVPAERLRALRVKTVARVVREHLRLGANGELTVRLTDDPRQVGWAQVELTDRNVYRGSFKGWACNYRHSTVTVPALWRTRVERRGLAVVDGLVTVDAAPLDGAPDGIDLYAASWLQQSRGTAVDLVRGYIARTGRISYHGATAERALAGLRRKLTAVEWTAKLQTADLSDLVGKHAAVTVHVADAKAMGACEYGIRAWCAAVGLDYEAGAASIADVYAGYIARPQPEARAAILCALRRARAH
jgi:hypothetical protein